MKSKDSAIVKENISKLKTGIDIQREIYKKANIENDFSTMAKCIQNIKSEITVQAKQKKQDQKIQRINKILNWYFDLPTKFYTKTPDGIQQKIPYNIELVINKNLTIAYQLIIEILHTINQI